MLRISAGREAEFERMRAWLAWSAALDRAIEAGEPGVAGEGRTVRPLPQALVAAYAANGLQPARTRGWQAVRAGT